MGFASPVLVLASLSWAVLTVGNGRIARWFQTAPRGALVFAWLVILGIALPGSIVISMLGYLLPAALLRQPAMRIYLIYLIHLSAEPLATND